MTAAGDATGYTGFVSFLVVLGCVWGCSVISVWPGARIHNFLALDSGTILGWELLTTPYSARVHGPAWHRGQMHTSGSCKEGSGVTDIRAWPPDVIEGRLFVPGCSDLK